MATLMELRNEHEEIMRRMEGLDKVVAALGQRQMLDGSLEIVLEVANFLENAMLTHFALEEASILPILARGSEEKRKLYEELMEDHVYLRQCIDSYLRLVKARDLGNEFQRLCADMIRRLAAHARKEDQRLIPLIAKTFQIEEDESLPEHAPPIIYSV